MERHRKQTQVITQSHTFLKESCCFYCLGIGVEEYLEGYQICLPYFIGFPISCHFMTEFQNFKEIPIINIILMLSTRYTLFSEKNVQVFTFSKVMLAIKKLF